MKKLTWLIVLIACLFSFSVSHAIQEGTPSDTTPNPKNAGMVYALLGAWNGSQWVRIQESSITGDAVPAVPSLATFNYNLAYNPNTAGWNRIYTGINTGVLAVDNSSNAFTRITTNTTTAVKATGGVLNDYIVNVVGTTSAVAFYNIAAAGCTGTPASGYAFTHDSLTTGSHLRTPAPITFTLGICVVTTGAAAADLTVLYR